MTLTIGIDFSGWEIFLDNLKRNCNTEVLLKDADDRFREDIELQFNEQGDPAWEPLSPTRLTERRNNGDYDPLILIDTGRLMTSWTEPGGDHIALIDSDSIEIGSSLYYAANMQYGGENEEGYIVPSRPVGIRDEALEKIANQILVNLCGE